MDVGELQELAFGDQTAAPTFGKNMGGEAGRRASGRRGELFISPDGGVTPKLCGRPVQTDSLRKAQFDGRSPLHSRGFQITCNFAHSRRVIL